LDEGYISSSTQTFEDGFLSEGQEIAVPEGHIFVMADQKKSVSEIIAEMREELRDDTGEDAELFAPYLSRPKKKAKPAGAKKKPKSAKKASKKPKGKAGKKPAKKKKRR